MTLLAVLLVIIGLLLTVLSLTNVKDYVRGLILLNKLPGPKAGLLGNMLEFICDQATLFKKIRHWSQEYGPVYRLNAAHIYGSYNISGPEDFEAIASTMKNIKKGLVYSFLDTWLGEGLLTSTGTKWQTRRKILTPAFHFSILQQFLTTFINETDNLIEELRVVCHKPYINVLPYMSHFTLSAINETAMGTKLNLENEEDMIYFSSIHRLGKILAHRITRPWLYGKRAFQYLSKYGYEYNRLVQILHNFTNRVIRKKSETFEKFDVSTEDENFSFSKKKKLAMMDLLLNAKFTDGSIDDQGIQDEVNTFMFEGHDTTSMALCFALMTLANHKNVQDLILQEINNVLGDKKPTYNSLQEMKYLERCIKECLRIYPSVPFIARTLEEDVKTSTGYIMAKGCLVQIHIFDIHRNPKFWPDPEKFDPDRFLPENCQNRHPFAYVPFSAGPRNCIGQRFAILEMKAALCGILRNFELEPVDTPENLVFVPDLVLRTVDDAVRIKFVPRKE